jgi:NitT/TauT family transport system substrate-binding protein
MRSLIRAQADIDLQPEPFKHYFINEIPERFQDKIDIRRFGVGERVVPQPYTRAMFDKTQSWMRAHNLFDGMENTDVSYEQAVRQV